MPAELDFDPASIENFMATTFPSIGFAEPEEPEYRVLDDRRQLQSWITVGVLSLVALLAYLDRFWSVVPMWFRAQYQYGFII
ncbi:MAG TPA: hypothetical protein VIY86_09810, partial [Pirellulaceae bacterium]